MVEDYRAKGSCNTSNEKSSFLRRGLGALVCSSVQFLLSVPIGIYMRMERQQSAVAGVIVAASILYGTYVSVRCISSPASLPQQQKI